MNDPADLPIFYGTRIMELSSLTTADNWFWCLVYLNPADLLTRTGSTLIYIDSGFWLHGSFLPIPENSWPTKNCASLLTDQAPLTTIIKTPTVPFNLLSYLITELLERKKSYSKVLNSLSYILKSCRHNHQPGNQLHPWTAVRNSITSFIISCFKPAAESFIAKNKLKQMVFHLQDGIYYVSDRSFRS